MVDKRISGLDSALKRKTITEEVDENGKDGDEENPRQRKLNAYIRELMAEKASLDQTKYPNAYKLLDEEIQKAQSSGRIPIREQKFVDIYRERPVKVSVKVSVPIKEHPRYNFVGKLLGQKGNTLKQLQEETMCHMAICGRGSIRDKTKEEELRQSMDPKFAHLQDDLHLDISTLGPPAEAHARIAFALAEIRKYLIPDYSESSRHELPMDFKPSHSFPPEEKSSLYRRRAPAPTPPFRRASPPQLPSLRPSRTGPPPPRSGKSKMVSILDRARVAMDEDLEYADDYDAREPHEYDDYRSSRPTGGHSRSTYPSDRFESEYEPDYYRNSGDSYGMSGPDFGYKKRKTYMD